LSSAPDNRKVLAFIRRNQDETIVGVANLSRFTQPAELDLAHCQRDGDVRPGGVPGDCGLHARSTSFCWFSRIATRDGWERAVDDRLRHCGPDAAGPAARAARTEGWDALLQERGRTSCNALPPWAQALVPLQGPRHHRCDDPGRIAVPVSGNVALVLTGVTYRGDQGPTRCHCDMPARRRAILAGSSAALARLALPDGREGTCRVRRCSFSAALLDMVAARRRTRSRGGEPSGRRRSASFAARTRPACHRQQGGAEQQLRDRRRPLMLKLFRRLEADQSRPRSPGS
jgi:hypothetical protein